MSDAPPRQVERLATQIYLLSKHIRHLRRQCLDQWRAEILDELHEAMKIGRQGAVAWQSRLLSARGAGPNRRNDGRPP
eukprot:7732446-Pyramimonas_sp.AAC.1